jgi:hypothetical protein
MRKWPAAWASVLLAACSPPGGGAPCSLTSPCAAGLTCVTGICRAVPDGGMADSGVGPDGGLPGDGGMPGDAGGLPDGGGDGGPADGGSVVLAPDGVCTTANWCWQNPRPYGNAIYSLHATSDSDIWVAGADGMLARWDGQWWRSFTQTEYLAPTEYNAIWGTAGDLWVFSVDALDGGQVQRWDGGTLSPIAVLDKSVHGAITTASGTSDSNLWVSTYLPDGVEQFDGTQWNVNGPFNVAIYDALSFSPTNVWAVGAPNAVFHYDGIQWSPATVPTTNDLASIWGSSSSDFWIGSLKGELLHYTPAGWNLYTPVGASAAMNLMGGSGPSDVWAYSAIPFACGTGGTCFINVVWRWDGSQWNQYSSTTGDSVGGARVSFLSPTNGWGLGTNGVWHWDGQQWSPPPDSRSNIDALSGSSATDVWAVGSSPQAILHWDGAHWTPVPSGVSPSVVLSSVASTGPSDAWIAGSAGTLLHGGVSGFATVALPTSADLTGVWTQTPGDVWVVGKQGTVLHQTAAGWNVEAADAGWPNLGGVFEDSAGTVWAYGDNSFRAEKENDQWSAITDALAGCNFTQMAENAPGHYLLEGDGCQATFDGQKWAQTQTAGGTMAIWKDWTASPTDSTDILTQVCGPAGCSQMDVRATQSVLWGVGGDVWLGGVNGAILHWH